MEKREHINTNAKVFLPCECIKKSLASLLNKKCVIFQRITANKHVRDEINLIHRLIEVQNSLLQIQHVTHERDSKTNHYTPHRVFVYKTSFKTLLICQESESVVIVNLYLFFTLFTILSREKATRMIELYK